MPSQNNKVLSQPIDVIFRFLQSKTRVQIWLYDQSNTRIEGQIAGFDEYMNIVLDNASEVNIKMKTRTNLGRILLKGDNVTLIQEIN
ncbi:small nuclear ribonucleoprotein E [Blastocystis sp. ATCC 50177/Nand II]|uniref:Small nuclear ribonucleoprotein E n=1 Tax=Blastocystis sp. subtype 1 (strain ATCC 50177 / NandII) TaxID=478820 RepID=A0A196S5A3_BLAHN|nr:small nuclear ribonucleoprotein E [Blastocystis sp. ATCC 50177/Nand II]